LIILEFDELNQVHRLYGILKGFYKLHELILE